MNRLLGHIRWMFRSRHSRRLDEWTMRIADRYGMWKEYLAARKIGLDSLSALDDRNLIRLEERALFLEPDNATTAPLSRHYGLDPQSPALNDMTNLT